MKKGLFLLFCILAFYFTGCKIKKPPTLSTVPISEIGPTTAKTGGNISDDGNADIIVRGVCWSIKKSPTTSDTRTTDGYGVGAFSSNLSGLVPNTLYYVRAYATNSEGTAFGNQITFTSSQLSVPEMTTVAVTGITQTAAVSGGLITFDGGTEITLRGVCWSTHTGPTTADSKSSDGGGTGTYSSNIAPLTGNTQYYVRAFATNTTGTGYGQEIPFTSGPLIPTVTTANPSPTGTTTGSGGGNISTDGGSPVTSRGICWSTTINPTISNSRTTDGTGTGTFTSNMTLLAPNTRYHVRAYASNNVGTAYGTDKTFSTDPVSIQDFDNNDYNVIRIGTQVWLQENLKTTHFNDGTVIPEVTGATEWSVLTNPGYCWYGNDESPNKDTYGALYNWFSVSSGILCPVGWHVSTDDEWYTLETYLGGYSPAGGKLKETGTIHWLAPNGGATNESGFTALPGGWRRDDGTFESVNSHGLWWTTTVFVSPEVWYEIIQYDDDKTRRGYKDNNYGMSVRCVKD